MNCQNCPGEISKRNRTGRCRSCAAKWAARSYPGLIEIRRAAGKAGAMKPGERERRAKRCAERRLWEIGTASRTEETFAKISRSNSERKMSWCPPELRGEAKRLTKSGFKLAEVKPMILEQHKAELDRFRRKLGVVVEARPAPAKPGRKPAWADCPAHLADEYARLKHRIGGHAARRQIEAREAMRLAA